MRRTRLFAILIVAVAIGLSGCGAKKSASPASPAAAVSAAPATGATGATAAGAAGTDANGCPTSNTTTLAKTKFVLHTGLAFGTFHRYIYKPFKAGTFSKGAQGRVLALVKAGATGLFDKREIRLAIEDVKANPTLCRTLAAPLRKLSDGFSSLGDKIKGGDTSGVSDLQNQVASVGAASAAGGAPITESTDESQG